MKDAPNFWKVLLGSTFTTDKLSYVLGMQMDALFTSMGNLKLQKNQK